MNTQFLYPFAQKNFIVLDKNKEKQTDVSVLSIDMSISQKIAYLRAMKKSEKNIEENPLPDDQVLEERGVNRHQPAHGQLHHGQRLGVVVQVDQDRRDQGVDEAGDEDGYEQLRLEDAPVRVARQDEKPRPARRLRPRVLLISVFINRHCNSPLEVRSQESGEKKSR